MALLANMANGKTSQVTHGLVSHLCGSLLLLSGSWSVFSSLYGPDDDVDTQDDELVWVNMVFFGHVFACFLIQIICVSISMTKAKASEMYTTAANNQGTHRT